MCGVSMWKNISSLCDMAYCGKDVEIQTAEACRRNSSLKVRKSHVPFAGLRPVHGRLSLYDNWVKMGV